MYTECLSDYIEMAFRSLSLLKLISSIDDLYIILRDFVGRVILVFVPRSKIRHLWLGRIVFGNIINLL